MQNQYIFIHNALNELLTCGETEITAANMRIAIGRLSRTVQSGTVTGFQKQYEVRSYELYVSIMAHPPPIADTVCIVYGRVLNFLL